MVDDPHVSVSCNQQEMTVTLGLHLGFGSSKLESEGGWPGTGHALKVALPPWAPRSQVPTYPGHVD